MDNAVDNTVLILLVLLLMFGMYSMVDSRLVYMSADAANYEEYKPTVNNSPSFKELQKINPDVFGWLTVINTEIDYPVVQGKDNDKYVNTDATGKYSLVGCLFLDYRNKKNFSDFNNIIYGHHMERNKLFGSLDEYKDQTYFEKHPYANIYFKGRKHGVEFFSFMQADAYDFQLYRIVSSKSKADRKEYLKYIKKHSYRKLPVKVSYKDTLIMLSTCTEDITNGRFLLIGKLVDKPFPEPKPKRNFGLGLGNATGLWALLPLWKWMILFFIILLILIYLISLWNDRRKARKYEDWEMVEEFRTPVEKLFIALKERRKPPRE
jgi:sortase B